MAQTPQKPAPKTEAELSKLLLKKTRTEQEEEVLKKLLSRLVEENPEAMAEIIKTWLAEGKK